MAAQETFESFNASLAQEEKELLRDLIMGKRFELLASRSEDARVRLVQDYIKDVHDILVQDK